MSYLICDNCEGFYELKADESPEDFVLQCNCGGNLEHVTHDDHGISSYHLEDDEPNRVSIVNGKGYAEKKSSKFNRLVIFGLTIGIFGFVGYYLGFTFTIILGLLGFILALYGYGSGISWNKGIKGENIVADCLDQLPDNYIIFNDVKFPGSRGNLDHVVVSPYGVFIIETKNINGFFLINDREWSYKKNMDTMTNFKRSKTQPGRQVMSNVMDLSKFFDSNGIDISEIWISPIVALVQNNFVVKKAPKYYTVLEPSAIPEFILKSEHHVSNNVANEIVSLLEPHSIEMSYRETDEK